MLWPFLAGVGYVPMDLQEVEGSPAIDSYGCIVATIGVPAAYWWPELRYRVFQAAVVLLA